MFKRIKFPILILLVISIVFIFIISSCKAEAIVETTGEVVETTGEVVETTGEVVEVAEEITINVWHTGVSALDWFDKWSSEYSKIHPNVKWNSIIFDASTPEKLFLALETGQNIDLFYSHVNWLKQTIPLTESFPVEVLSPEYLLKTTTQHEPLIIDGKVLTYAYGVMTAGLLINTDYWDEAGLTEEDIPKTWEEAAKVAEKLTTRAENGAIIRAGWNFENNYDLWQELNYQQGSFLVNADGTYNINTEIGRKSAQYLQDLYYKYKVCDPGFTSCFDSFGNGSSAMIHSWGWIEQYYKTSFPELKYRWITIPTFDDSIIPPAYEQNNYELSYGVAKNTSEEAKAVCFDFQKFIFDNDEAIFEKCVQFGIVPSKISVSENYKFDEPQTSQASIMERTIWTGTAGSSTLTTLKNKYIGGEIMTSNKSVEEVLAAFQKEFDTMDKADPSWERKYKYEDELSDPEKLQ